MTNTDVQQRNALAERTGLINPGFLWRMSSGHTIAPAEMRTSHLFHTVRMIWNNKMPEAAQTCEYFRRYCFGDQYPDSYMVDAIRCMVPELFNRGDLTLSERAEIQKMIDWLYNRPDDLMFSDVKSLTSN